MLQKAGVLHILTCKCASRHSGVRFLDIGSSKSGPNMWCFAHFYLQTCFAPQRRAILPDRNFQNCSLRFFAQFDLKMCFAPQPRAIFEHRNFQNRSRTEVFCAVWLENALRATAACHFWTSELPKLVRDCGVLCIWTWKCASRHSRVPFLNIGTCKMAPTMRCFVHLDLQMCFAPQRRAIFHLCARTATSAPAALARLLFEHQEPRIIEKTQRFATSLTFFARVPSF